MLVAGIILRNVNNGHVISGLRSSWTKEFRGIALSIIFLRSGLELDLGVRFVFGGICPHSFHIFVEAAYLIHMDSFGRTHSIEMNEQLSLAIYFAPILVFLRPLPNRQSTVKWRIFHPSKISNGKYIWSYLLAVTPNRQSKTKISSVFMELRAPEVFPQGCPCTLPSICCCSVYSLCFQHHQVFNTISGLNLRIEISADFQESWACCSPTALHPWTHWSIFRWRNCHTNSEHACHFCLCIGVHPEGCWSCSCNPVHVWMPTKTTGPEQSNSSHCGCCSLFWWWTLRWKPQYLLQKQFWCPNK